MTTVPTSHLRAPRRSPAAPPELLGIDHLELWVGNARQAAGFFAAALGFDVVAHAGPETGVTDHASYVLEQGEITIAVTAALGPDYPIAEHVRRHGDGVHAVCFRVPDAPMGELFIDDLAKLRKLLFYDPDHPSVSLAMPRSLDDPRMLHWLRAREATARVGWNPYLHNPRLPRHLRRIACPTLILWGRHDRLLPPRIGQFLAEQIPGAQLEIFDACGHMLPFEQTEPFVARTTQFLTTTPGRA